MGLCPVMSRPVVIPEHDPMRGKGSEGPEARLEEVYCRYNECEARYCSRGLASIRCDPDNQQCKKDPCACEHSFCRMIQQGGS